MAASTALSDRRKGSRIRGGDRSKAQVGWLACMRKARAYVTFRAGRNTHWGWYATSYWRPMLCFALEVAQRKLRPRQNSVRLSFPRQR